MKIEKWVTVSIDGQGSDFQIDVHVTADDISRVFVDTPESKFQAFNGLNNFYAFLKGIPDSVIAEFDKRQLDVAASFLEEQAKRYRDAAALLETKEVSSDGSQN